MRSRLVIGDQGRRWLVISAAVSALVIAGIALAAASIARGGSQDSLRAFERASNEVAATLHLEIERTQGLIESAAAFIAVNPGWSNSQFGRLSSAMRWRQRHPEVGGFGFVVPVPATQLADFAARMEANPIDPANRGVPFEVTPEGARPYYCLAALGQWRDAFGFDVALGEDFCAGLSAGPLMRILESGERLYFPMSLGERGGLAITAPVYRGGGVPGTEELRRRRFIGWLGTIVAQEQLLASALATHPGLAATLRYHGDGPLPAAFTSGNAPEGARSMTRQLDEDWTLETAGSVAAAAIWADGGALALLILGVPTGVLLGGFVYVLGTGRARAQRLVAERTDQLRFQALHDPLTNLPNRELVTDRAEHLLDRNRRHGTAGAALFVDIDDFKNVNDSLGHDAGDQVLQAVGERMRIALRDADTIGRLGGDEFVILIDGSEVKSAPELVAQRLLEVMRQPFEIVGSPEALPVSASIGIAIGDRESAGELLRDADVALYEAKLAGKNRYETFDSEMWDEASYRIGLEFDLRSALEREQFRLVYQPIYELEGLTVVGVEALLRWEHPVKGTVQPDEFIPVLERTGQITQVGEWVLQTACAQAAKWGERHGPLNLSVNLSARQLETDRIVGEIGSALESSGLAPGSLVVEITETALMHNVEATAKRLREIKSLGARVAVDDFGTGYSSMAYLKRFPVDCLKIDRAFTEAITSATAPAPLFDTLIQLGRNLGLTTLAEGIERVEQIDHLRAERVQEAQGFLFSRPVEPERLEDLLLDTRPDSSTASEPSV